MRSHSEVLSKAETETLARDAIQPISYMSSQQTARAQLRLRGKQTMANLSKLRGRLCTGRKHIHFLYPEGI